MALLPTEQEDEGMRVLKRGKVSDLWYGQCDRCRAIVEAHEEELKNIRQGDHTNDYERYSLEDCPECGFQSSTCFYQKDSRTNQYLIELNNLGSPPTEE